MNEFIRGFNIGIMQACGFSPMMNPMNCCMSTPSLFFGGMTMCGPSIFGPSMPMSMPMSLGGFPSIYSMPITPMPMGMLNFEQNLNFNIGNNTPINNISTQTTQLSSNNSFVPQIKFGLIGDTPSLTSTSFSSNSGTSSTSSSSKSSTTKYSNDPKNWKKTYGNYTREATGKCGKTAGQLNKMLKGKGVLEGKGQAFLDAEKKYGINASVLIAIAIHESGNGKSNHAKKRNNIAGIRIAGSKQFRKFNSVNECIDHLASLLKRNYVNKGYTQLYQINAKYCPASDNTDYAHTNSSWAKRVDNIAQEVENLA